MVGEVPPQQALLKLRRDRQQEAARAEELGRWGQAVALACVLVAPATSRHGTPVRDHIVETAEWLNELLATPPDDSDETPRLNPCCQIPTYLGHTDQCTQRGNTP